MSRRGEVRLHATCVAVDTRGVLILGPSGSGKSALALQLLAFGARLVADDQTEVTRVGDALMARCPPTLSGLIEARGIGILRARPVDEAQLVLAVDMQHEETERLPPPQTISILGLTLDLVLKSQSYHFPAALLCYLKGGRQD